MVFFIFLINIGSERPLIKTNHRRRAALQTHSINFYDLSYSNKFNRYSDDSPNANTYLKNFNGISGMIL